MYNVKACTDHTSGPSTFNINRLGCLKGGVADIKNHSWFANVNWENMMNQRESPPIQPKVKVNFYPENIAGIADC